MVREIAVAVHRNCPFVVIGVCSGEQLLFQERMRAWRFYDHFRTDNEASARRRQVGTRTQVLASDGSDLAAAMATIQEIGADDALGAAIADAFPGGSIDICDADGYFELEMRQHGLLRSLKTSELSDGTLRDLLLVAALLKPRPPQLMILNEPETSLHPDLLPPLARLIAQASERSQIIFVSHAASLVSALHDAGAPANRSDERIGRDARA
jgi:predicted ATPase